MSFFQGAYELRKYEAGNWICTVTKDFDTKSDPLNAWRKKYDNNALKALDIMTKLKDYR